MTNSPSNKPLEIKISTLVAVSAMLRELDLVVLDSVLRAMTAGASDYFDHEFTVLDLEKYASDSHAVDWAALIQLFKSYSLNPVAVRNAPADMHAAIVASGLSIDVATKPRSSDAEANRAPSAPEPVPVSAPAPVSASTMMIDTPVRAGQRIYARGSDLVITAAVNHGAEIIADGSIHIYAPLRGRALAGANGNASARIFTLSMEAELVSIAGTYRTFENGLPKEVLKKPAQIQLDGSRIDVLSIAS